MLTAVPQKTVVSEEGLASLKQAEQFLSCGRSFLYRLMETNELKFAKCGKSRKIPWAELRAYAQRCLVS